MEFRFRNVNDSFNTMVSFFNRGVDQDAPVVRKPYSNPNGSGHRLQIDEPVLIHYTKPRERVLFNTARDANPFFHLFEALWMLAGRNDVAPLAYYVKDMARFSDDGKTYNGAYGYRWRHTGMQDRPLGEEVDQLDLLVTHLTKNPQSSRAVLSMWNVEDDLLKVGDYGTYPCCEAVRRVERVPGDATTLTGGECPIHGTTTFQPGSRDVACNLNVIFSVREYKGPESTPADDYLDMTVTNRSNDLVWGCLGTNFVHFTLLQEYMAARLKVEVGRYCHMTNNLHVYVDGPVQNWKPQEWLKANEGQPTIGRPYVTVQGRYQEPLFPLVKDPNRFDDEVKEFVERHGKGAMANEYHEPFLEYVAQPMMVAYHHHKAKRSERALGTVEAIRAPDWRLACRQWLTKRVK